MEHAIHGLHQLPPWLKTIAVRTWIKQLQRNDPLSKLDPEATAPDPACANASSMALDLDGALARLGDAV